MSSPVYKFFTQGDTAEYREAMSRAADGALYEQFISLNKPPMLVGDLVVRMEMDADNIYTPKDLVEEAKTNKMVGSLLASALITINMMTIEELAEFKIKWKNRIK